MLELTVVQYLEVRTCEYNRQRDKHIPATEAKRARKAE